MIKPSLAASWNAVLNSIATGSPDVTSWVLKALRGPEVGAGKAASRANAWQIAEERALAEEQARKSEHQDRVRRAKQATQTYLKSQLTADRLSQALAIVLEQLREFQVVPLPSSSTRFAWSEDERAWKRARIVHVRDGVSDSEFELQLWHRLGCDVYNFGSLQVEFVVRRADASPANLARGVLHRGLLLTVGPVEEAASQLSDVYEHVEFGLERHLASVFPEDPTNLYRSLTNGIAAYITTAVAP